MNPSSSHSDWDRLLAKLDVPEGRYKADLALHDKAQAFSSELLKLALGGIAIVGFLLAHLPKERLIVVLEDTAVELLFASAVAAFSLSVASALLQRFYASAAMFHHLHVIKLSLLADPPPEAEIAGQMQIRGKKFLQAHALLKATAWLLVVAALLIGGAIVRMIFLHA